MTVTPQEVIAVLRNADMLYSAKEVDVAFDRLAAAITQRLDGKNPLMMVVMNGGMIPAVNLLTRMDFPIQVGYLHASRYRGEIRGRDLQWLVPPSIAVKDRLVLVVDDIYDEGTTLAAIVEQLKADGASEVLTAVLINKIHDRKESLEVDFVGLTVPDRYVFGCGMDYKEYLRNLPGIYAIPEEGE